MAKKIFPIVLTGLTVFSLVSALPSAVLAQNNGNNNDISVKAEVFGTSTLARVEVEFNSTAVEKNAITQEILNKLKLSKDDISRILVIQIKTGQEELREKLEVKSEIKGGRSENEAKFRFPLSVTARDQIIDGIFQKLQALTITQIVNAIEVKDDSGLRLGQVIKLITPPSDLIRETRETLVVDPNGAFRFTGANLESVSGTNLNVSLFGISFTVNATSAVILNQTATGTATLADFKVNDKIAAEGTFNRITRAIMATRVFDQTLGTQTVSDIQRRIQELLNLVRQLQDQLRLRGIGR